MGQFYWKLRKYFLNHWEFSWKVMKVRNFLNAWFTFSLRQHKTRWEQECEGYICLVFHTLDLFLSHPETIGRGLFSLKIYADSILSIYYRYLIQGIIHLESLYIIIFCLLKKLASKVKIESLNRFEMTCGLLGEAMKWTMGGPEINSRRGKYKFDFYFFNGVF